MRHTNQSSSLALLSSPSLNLPSSSYQSSQANQTGRYPDANSKRRRDGGANKSRSKKATPSSGGKNMSSQAIAVSNQSLGQEFSKVHNEMLESINQIQDLAELEQKTTQAADDVVES